MIETHPLVGQAVYVASPTLYYAMSAWLRGEPVRNKRTRLRVLAYLLRMATRPTPFGLFASVGEVAVGERSTLSVDSASRMTRSRPDMEWLLRCARDAERDHALRRKLRFFASGYSVSREDRIYARSPDITTVNADGHSVPLHYEPVSIARTQTAEAVLLEAQHGADYSALCDFVANRTGAPMERIERLIDQLHSGGLLVSSVRPTPIGEPAKQLMRELSGTEYARAGEISTFIDALERLDGTPLEERSVEDYRAAVAIATAVAECPSTFQVDMRHRFHGALGRSVLEDVTKLAKYWLRSSLRGGLKAYRDRFVEHYGGAERRVPLLELVDDDFGIGPPPANISFEHDIDLPRRHALLRLATRAHSARTIVVDVDDDELDEVLGPMPEGDVIASSFELGFEIAARELDDLDRFQYTAGPAAMTCTYEAAQSVGRFADMFGPEFIERIRTFHEHCATDAIDAELVLMPGHDRSANVCVRPAIHNHEINFATPTPHAGVHRIPLSDLMIGLEGDRLHAWSRSLNREVRVHQGHLLNPKSNVPPACQLLALLAADGRIYPAGFNWGPAAILPMVPRVRFGRLVLSNAKWMTPRSTFQVPRSDLARAVHTWRTAWLVPGTVYLVHKDNRLPINLETAVGLDLLGDQLRSIPDQFIVFEEVYPPLDSSWLGGFRAEFVANFRSLRQPVARPAGFAGADVAAVRQSTPGSDWCYVKLYRGAAHLDRVLHDRVALLIERLAQDGLIDRWFFVRYADPAQHVRLRMRASAGTPPAQLMTAVARHCGALHSADAIDRYAFDTYDREFERYGGSDGFDDVEAFFDLDSRRSLSRLRDSGSAYDERVVTTIADFDALLLRALPPSTLEGFFTRLRTDDSRALKQAWPIVRSVQDHIAAYRRLAAEDDRATVKLVQRLQSAALTRRPEEIVFSIFHMHCNRMGIAAGDDERIVRLCLAAAYRGLAERGLLLNRAQPAEPATTAWNT